MTHSHVPLKVRNQDLTRLYREHGRRVYRRALRLLGNHPDAEEATQEVFMRVIRTEAGYKGHGKILGWLYRITTHYCLDRIRAQRRRRKLFQTHVAPALQRIAPPVTTQQVMLRWLLSNADERQAQAAAYVYLDGMSYEESAPLLGISKRTVGNLLERFQAWCAEQLRMASAELAALLAVAAA